MVLVKDSLWVADEDTGTIFQFKLEENVFNLSGKYTLDMHNPGKFKLSGITCDGRNLRTVSEGSGMIFRHPLSE